MKSEEADQEVGQEVANVEDREHMEEQLALIREIK